ncbi:MAG: sugar phosphate nucleotidyltransferase, partial [Bacilli bacterium]
MKVVILAGGFGTRISEESYLKPKPMIEIGGRPILWHIMKLYSHYGYNEFVICAGYKQEVIKDYFASYFIRNSNVTFDLSNPENMVIHNNVSEPWKVTIVYTGLSTMTGGRIKRVKEYLDNEPFMLTYGDGVANIDIKKLVDFHQKHGKTMTISATQPEGRFGVIDMEANGKIKAFREKSQADTGFVNIGFMVCN